ncbi:MAG: hypothetical protein QMC93_02990 [Patescibacteria group bacterium]|nr:hypothetical protein [Patescibacteria group bacterium]
MKALNEKVERKKRNSRFVPILAAAIIVGLLAMTVYTLWPVPSPQPSPQPSSSVLEITASQLLEKYIKYRRENDTELGNWLRSLEGKTIRLSGEIFDTSVNTKEDNPLEITAKSLYFIGVDGGTYYLLVVVARAEECDLNLVKDLRAGDYVTIEGVVEQMLPPDHKIAGRIRFEKLVEVKKYGD